MLMKLELRYASQPDDAKNYDTTRLRKEFLIENIFVEDEITFVYSMYDRYMVGGAIPVKNELMLETPEELKSEYFLNRREMGIINVGGDAVIEAGGTGYKLGFKEALYLGKGQEMLFLNQLMQNNPAKLYIQFGSCAPFISFEKSDT